MPERRSTLSRLRPHAWSPETWVCSMRGHVTPAADVAQLRDTDSTIGIPLDDATRLVRCLRCDLWLAVDNPTDPVAETLPERDQLPRPRRGVKLDEGIMLRLIAIERGFHAVLFTVLAAGFIYLDLHVRSVHHWAQSLLAELAAGGHPLLSSELGKLIHLRSSTVAILIASASAYAVVEAVEAVGLWKEKRWAEYLTVVATAGFLPLEIHELLGKVSVLRLSALVVNLAILVYLLVAKRLFGIRGGAKAAAAEGTDWDAVFATPVADHYIARKL